MQINPNHFCPEAPKGFVVLEGVNGAGKSTLQRRIAERLTEQKISHITSHEPGATALGIQLRELLLHQSAQSRSALAEAFLFSADRAEHVETVLRPAIEDSQLVLLDRYYYSTVAFQGFGRGLDIEVLLELSELAIGELTPDLVILLDLDPAAGLARNKDKQEIDSFEDEQISFHQKLREGFLEMAEILPEPFVILDANLPADEVFEQAYELVLKSVYPLSTLSEAKKSS